MRGRNSEPWFAAAEQRRRGAKGDSVAFRRLEVFYMSGGARNGYFIQKTSRRKMVDKSAPKSSPAQGSEYHSRMGPRGEVRQQSKKGRESKVAQSCQTPAAPWIAACQILRPWDSPGRAKGRLLPSSRDLLD